jgi:hypothetical protein
LKKRDAFLKISICDTFFGFHKKNEKGKEKVVFQAEGIEKVVVQLPYMWGYVESINIIRRSKLKVEVWGEFFLNEILDSLSMKLIDSNRLLF